MSTAKVALGSYQIAKANQPDEVILGSNLVRG